MSQRRTLILVAAIAIGLVAAFLVWNYVDGVRDDAMGEAKMVSVYVVKQTIPKSTSAEQAGPQIVQENIPQKFRPDNAVTNLADISGRVAVTDLPTNQILVKEQWVEASDPSARTSFSEKLRQINGEDMTAISIRVDPVTGVGGFLEPGDYVNIMARPNATEVVGTMNRKTDDQTLYNDGSEQPSGDLLVRPARYVYLKAEILAVGASATPTLGAAAEEQATGPSDPFLLTLIVPTDAAQVIASIADGSIMLTQVPDDYTPTVQTPLDLQAPFAAESDGILTPYGPDGADSGR